MDVLRPISNFIKDQNFQASLAIRSEIRKLSVYESKRIDFGKITQVLETF